MLGDPGVNVLELNLALDDVAPIDAAERERTSVGGQNELMTDRREPAAQARGTLRVYLGAAPGVGKTFAMLNEGQRRQERGTDVVVGVRRDPRSPFTRPRRSATSRSSPAARSSTAAATLDRDGPRRHPCAAGPSWSSSTSSPTPTRPGRATTSGGRTSRSCSPPASTSSRPSTSSTSSRSTTSSSGSPGSASARPFPTASCAPPTRSSSSTWRPRRCADGWPTATCTPPTRSTPRSATTSAPATCRRCASWRCCGSPTASTTRCRTTASATGSRAPWETRERVVVALAGAPAGDHG